MWKKIETKSILNLIWYLKIYLHKLLNKFKVIGKRWLSVSRSVYYYYYDCKFCSVLSNYCCFMLLPRCQFRCRYYFQCQNIPVLLVSLLVPDVPIASISLPHCCDSSRGVDVRARGCLSLRNHFLVDHLEYLFWKHITNLVFWLSPGSCG